MINEILIIAGAVILFFALFLFVSFRKNEKIAFGILSREIKIINTIFHLLILFFFVGYCLIFIQLYKNPQICKNSQSGVLISLLSQVLFGGAVFVVITIFLLKLMLENIVKAKLDQVDSLTTLYNKMSGNFKINEILISQQKPIFLAILDLDNFKKANDIYGHLIGDEILVEMSKIIKLNIGEKDIACRFGGDEFVICLLGKKENKAKVIFNQIKNDINKIAENYIEANISVSIGVAYGVGKGAGGSTTCKILMQNADKALYHVKKNGKNSVHFYSENNNVYS